MYFCGVENQQRFAVLYNIQIMRQKKDTIKYEDCKYYVGDSNVETDCYQPYCPYVDRDDVNVFEGDPIDQEKKITEQ